MRQGMRAQVCFGLAISSVLCLAPAFASVPSSSTKEKTENSSAASEKPSAHESSSPSKKSSESSSNDQSEDASSFTDGKMKLTSKVHKNGFHKGEPVVVVVDKSSHYTYVFALESGDKVVEVLRASNAVGSADTPTPFGPYKVTYKKKYPSWVPPKDIDPKQKVIPPYNETHKNPLGVAEIGLNKFGIYMHGTNDPKSLRHNVSHGCIRHSNEDIMRIFSMVNPGTTVIISKHMVGTTLTKDEFESEKGTKVSSNSHHTAARTKKH